MIEIWKDIKDYEGFYQISSLGRVKSLERISIRGKEKKRYLQKEKILTQSNHPQGYKCIMLCKYNKAKRMYVHRLIAKYFIVNIEKLKQVNHKNGIKDDNRIENLEWCTSKQNINHSVKSDTFGICNIKYKYIQVIRAMIIHTSLQIKDIADIFGVSAKTISSINKNHNYKDEKWKHVNPKDRDGKYQNSKLTKNEVLEVKKVLSKNKHLDREIAEMFNVDRKVINQIKLGKTWKHLQI